jgi:hypothetical protein
LNNKSDKSNTYLKSEIDNFNNVLNNDINAKANVSSIDLGGVYRLSKSTDNSSFSIDRFDNSGSINANAWISLFKLDFNDETNTVKFYVNKLNMFDLINDKISNQTFTDTIALYVMNKYVYNKTTINDSITTLNNSINLKANTSLLDSYYTKAIMEHLLSTNNTNVSNKAN